MHIITYGQHKLQAEYLEIELYPGHAKHWLCQ